MATIQSYLIGMGRTCTFDDTVVLPGILADDHDSPYLPSTVGPAVELRMIALGDWCVRDDQAGPPLRVVFGNTGEGMIWVRPDTAGAQRFALSPRTRVLRLE